MSLQFNAEGINGPLVSLSYRSSDEDMEVDSIYSVQDTAPQDSDDDDNQVIACYSENREFPPQLAAGRAMTSDLSTCLGYLSLPETTETATGNYFTDPSEDLMEWFVGSPPSTYSGLQLQQHPIAQCSQIDPVSYSPMSPPLVDQFPNYAPRDNECEVQAEPQWARNQHITGLGISASGLCGQPNDVLYSGCVVCGKSFQAIKEEVTLGYLESTHLPGETYDQRQSRRRAFEAGMKAGSFIVIPRGVSEAAACDGILYRVGPEDDNTNPGPGILPI